MMEKLLLLRKSLKLSREEMAATLGYSAGQLGRYERGEQAPTEIFYKVVLERYGIPKEYFLDTLHSSEDGMSGGSLVEKNVPAINWKAVGKRIKEIRSNLGMSQSQFAKHIGCAKGTIAQAEATGKVLSDRLIEYIAENCDVGKDWILYGDEGKKNYPVNEEMIRYLWENEDTRKAIWEKMRASLHSTGVEQA